MKKLELLLLISFLMAGVPFASAQDTATPVVKPTTVPTAAPTAAATAPSTTPVVNNKAEIPPMTLGDQNPSQAEGDKAPATSRPTAVPKFSLPDVVITGKNELTIGAKRLETVGSDVSWGAQNLTDLNRNSDDLPGLNKSLTALSTQETGESQDTTLILHGGGGIPGTLGGWGLFGKDLRDMEFILSGYYSTWGGQALNGGLDGDQKYRYGGEFKLMPTDALQMRLSIYSEQVSDNLPYQVAQNAAQEIHQGLDVNAGLNYKWSSAWRTELAFTTKTLTLNYWDQNNLGDQATDFNGRISIIGEEMDPFWNAFTLEAGDYQENSNFTVSPNNTYNLAWANVSSRFIPIENVEVNGSVEGQSGNGPNLDNKLFPAAGLKWRFMEDTQVGVYWKTARKLESFYDLYMSREHVSPESELPGSSEVTGEWGASFTQKWNETMVFTLGASTAQIINYNQWTDIDPSSPNYIENYSTVPAVEVDRVTADLQWKLDDVWKAAFNYQFTQGLNKSGNNANLTFLPQNQGVVSLTRADDQWDATVSLVAVSDRQALDTASLDLPAFATFNLSADYHVNRSFSLWFKGDNLLGTSYMLEPGYLEPQVHLRAGVEIIF